MFKTLSPNSLVTNIEASVAIYKLLGFKKPVQMPETGKPDRVILKDDEVALLLQDKPSAESNLPSWYTNRQSAGAQLYFDLEHMEELPSCIDGNALFMKEIHTAFYGTNKFMIVDPDHFLLIFAEDKKES
jgi:hypothetical protein